MADENRPSDTVPEAVDVAATEGKEKVGSVADTPDTLAQINAATGRNYPDLDTALKAVGDTYKFVGQKPTSDGPVPEVEARIKQMEDDLFFSRHPEYEDYRPVISKMGSNPAEVIASEEFKTIYEKAKGYDESQSVKSVLHSNPRLGVVKDKLGEAREKLAQAYQAPDSVSAQRLAGEAERSALGAVMESFDLN